MSSIRVAAVSTGALVAGPALPLVWDHPVAYVLYAWLTITCVVLIVASVRAAFDEGHRAGERAHRLTHLAEVIRLPTRRAS
jgi:hypothetical protein